MLAKEFVVHHKQGLCRDDRLCALARNLGWIDKVEVRANAILRGCVRTHHRQVDSALICLRRSWLAMRVVGRIHPLLHQGTAVLHLLQDQSRSTLTDHQPATDCQQTIANRLRIQPLPIHPPQQPVVRIDLQSSLAIEATLSIGAAEYQRANQLLDRPTFIHESGCQMVQQFGV